MTIETLPFEHLPRNSIANNIDKINELVDWVNLDTHLYASASGESVTVGNPSSLKGLQVHGKSVQDGTPTPDAPVPVEAVEGPLSLVIGDTSVAIDLQGNTLASLPDGTRDELHVDSAGHCVLTKNVGKYVITGQENGSTSQLGDYYRFYSNPIEDMQAPLQVVQGSINGYCTHSPYEVNYTGQYVHAYVIQGKKLLVFSTSATPLNDFVGAELYYPLATPQTIDLGYIAPPAIPSGSTVTISASLTPGFQLEWWVDDGITTVVNDLIAYVDYKTEG